jgi:hypothetical protein
MDKCGTNEGFLLIFDRRENVPWSKKVFNDQRTVRGTVIKIYGM